jgi:hypothetical protein
MDQDLSDGSVMNMIMGPYVVSQAYIFTVYVISLSFLKM